MSALTPAAVDRVSGVLVSLLTGPTILAAGVRLGVIAERAGWVR